MRLLRYMAGLMLTAIIGVGCATATRIDESPVPVSPLTTWDPSQSDTFTDASVGTGTLNIDDGCVRLILENQTSILLVWPEPTSWDEATQTIEFVDFQGEQIALRDGEQITPGGSTITGDFPFVSPPDPSCQADEMFVVNSLGELTRN
ncbi:MAG: hypothetical protein GFH27_549279n72 [Chloroflexi bacterium AL-W]|nr:hypothetical protein [Chloroflexi bacterium AL-N1]NOK65038.1 hypothetical protein [Chloroflexi bacterium AL-N10]NOK72695.1 hypothetical protein [Chloroflexi bacterium AL-N5]NOK79217.1 hypothetical protein [Chloroflexi bacterium AL-W]NOK87133.1 hypothetical protein [Chloroflexi bacterium AL-N15]